VEYLHICPIKVEMLLQQINRFCSEVLSWHGIGKKWKWGWDSPSVLSPCLAHVAIHRGHVCGQMGANSRTGNKNNTTTHHGVKLPHSFLSRDENQILRGRYFCIALLATSDMANGMKYL